MVVAAVLGLAGCGLHDPYNDPASGGGTVPARTQSTSPQATRARPSGGPGPQGTLRRAALLSGNWTAATIASRFRALAAMSVGSAREDFTQEAQQAARDAEVAESGLRSTAVVEGVIVHGTGDRRDAVVVTRGSLSSKDLQQVQPTYHITLAVVVRQAASWKVSRWASPQQ
jgi:hypothetical protein